MNTGMVDQSGFNIGTTCINSKRSLSSAQRHTSGIQLWSSPSVPDKSFVGGPILVKCCLKVQVLPASQNSYEAQARLELTVGLKPEKLKLLEG